VDAKARHFLGFQSLVESLLLLKFLLAFARTEPRRYGRKKSHHKKIYEKGFIISLFIAIEGQRLSTYSPTPTPDAGWKKGKRET